MGQDGIYFNGLMDPLWDLVGKELESVKVELSKFFSIKKYGDKKKWGWWEDFIFKYREIFKVGF